MSDVVVTKKGTHLPLLNLKGKKYLMIAYRIQWLNEEVENFSITTEFLIMTDEETVAKATVVLMDKDGKVIKTTTATKRETKKDFSDHLEKAETAAIGRAVSILGYGTQFALSDLDEGNRLADSPLVAVLHKEDGSKQALNKEEAKSYEPQEAPKKTASSFRKPKTEVPKVEAKKEEPAKAEVTPEQEAEWS